MRTVEIMGESLDLPEYPCDLYGDWFLTEDSGLRLDVTACMLLGQQFSIKDIKSGIAFRFPEVDHPVYVHPPEYDGTLDRRLRPSRSDAGAARLLEIMARRNYASAIRYRPENTEPFECNFANLLGVYEFGRGETMPIAVTRAAILALIGRQVTD